jgi:hypothetical protein
MSEEFRKKSSGETLPSKQGFRPPLHPASHPKLKAPYCLHLPIIRAVEIRLRGPDMRMAHQRLDGFEVISLSRSVVAKVCLITWG